jgi:hypothetical protein
MTKARRALSRFGLCLLWWAGTCHPQAHELRPAYLEIQQIAQATFDVLWNVPAPGGVPLWGLEVALPEGVRVETCRTNLVDNAQVERRRVVRPGGLAGQSIRVVGLDATFADVLVRVRPLNGRVQVERLTPDRPGFVVQVGGSTWATVRTYLSLGTEHILLGVDHLLFVLGLLLIVPQRWMLLKTITAFTLAHSITLAVATLGYATAPADPLNVCIALSILFLGPEIVRSRRGGTSLTLRRPWVVAFTFGLLHGFGFASGLSLLGLPAEEIPLALLCFNLGVEIGQVGFVGLALGLAWSFRILQIRWPRWVAATPGVAVGSLGAYWFVQRLFLMIARW